MARRGELRWAGLYRTLADVPGRRAAIIRHSLPLALPRTPRCARLEWALSNCTAPRPSDTVPHTAPHRLGTSSTTVKNRRVVMSKQLVGDVYLSQTENMSTNLCLRRCFSEMGRRRKQFYRLRSHGMGWAILAERAVFAIFFSYLLAMGPAGTDTGGEF